MKTNYMKALSMNPAERNGLFAPWFQISHYFNDHIVGETEGAFVYDSEQKAREAGMIAAAIQNATGKFPNLCEPLVGIDLTIYHNHGNMKLRNAILVEYEIEYRDNDGRMKKGVGRQAFGIIVGGGETSRLFHATSSKAYKVGDVGTWDLYAHKVRDEGAGNYSVDVCFCG